MRLLHSTCTMLRSASDKAKHLLHVQRVSSNSQQGGDAGACAAGAPAAAAKRTKRQNFDYKPWRAAMAVALVTFAHCMVGRDKTDVLLDHVCKFFEAVNPQQLSTKHKEYLAADVFQRLLTRGTLEDRPRPGRPGSVSEEHTDKMIEAFVRGMPAGNGRLWWGYTSYDHAYRASEDFKKLVDDAQLSDRQLWRLMQQRHVAVYGVMLNKIRLQVKLALNPEVKRDRLQAAHDWLGSMVTKFGEDWLERVIWLDEKQTYISPGGSYYCYGRHTQRSQQIEDPNAELPRTKVKWLLGTSAILGCVWFELVTGTTDKPLEYKVRTSVPSRTDQHPASLIPLLPRCMHNVELVLRVLTADAQDVVARLRCFFADALVIAQLLCIAARIAAQVLLTIPKDEQPAAHR